jgi:hypothetical protein
MRCLDFSRYILGSAVSAMLAGCGGAQLQIGAPRSFDSITQNRTVAQLNASALGLREWASAKPQYNVASPLMFVVNWSTPSGVGNVVVYDPATNDPNPIAVITTGIDEPNGDCVDASGTLYVGSDPGSSGWISEYAPGKTKPFKTITDGLDQPALCTIDGQGNLWVTNNGGAPTVTEYLKGSTKPHSTITKGLTYPIGIAIDQDGNLYVGNHVLYGTTNVQVYPAGSTSPTRTITDGVVWPIGITVDAKDTLYVANDGPPCNVEEYRAGRSRPYRTITDQIAGPTGLSIGKNGWLYVSNEGLQGCSGPSPVLLEFRPGSIEPSGKMISKDLQTPIGNAHFPPLR